MVEAETDEQVRALGDADPALTTGLGRYELCPPRLRPQLEGRARPLLRERAEGDRRSFAETKELIAGYWLWQVESMEEAIEWVKRIPNPTGEESVIEIRPVFETEDFGDELTPELREKERQLRAQTEAGA